MTDSEANLRLGQMYEAMLGCTLKEGLLNVSGDQHSRLVALVKQVYQEGYMKAVEVNGY